MGVSVLIPALVGITVDEIRGDGSELWPLGLAVAGAGVLRLVFSVARRLVAGRVSLGVEYDLRNTMYEHLQSLELAFFDGQQTGQLMSRATVDLQLRDQRRTVIGHARRRRFGFGSEIHAPGRRPCPIRDRGGSATLP